MPINVPKLNSNNLLPVAMVEGLASQLTTLTAGQAALGTQIGAYTAQINAANTNATTALTVANAVDAQLPGLRARVLAAETSATNAVAAATANDARITGAENDAAAALAAATTNSGRLTAVETVAADAQADATAALAAATGAQATASSLNSRIAAVETDVASLGSDISDNTSDIASLQTQITGNDADIASLITRVTTNESDIAGLSGGGGGTGGGGGVYREIISMAYAAEDATLGWTESGKGVFVSFVTAPTEGGINCFWVHTRGADTSATTTIKATIYEYDAGHTSITKIASINGGVVEGGIGRYRLSMPSGTLQANRSYAVSLTSPGLVYMQLRNYSSAQNSYRMLMGKFNTYADANSYSGIAFSANDAKVPAFAIGTI